MIPNLWNTENYDIGDLSGSTLKIPLIEDVIIPLASEMSFNYDGKQFDVKQNGSVLTNTWAKLIPLLVSQQWGKTFNFITSYRKFGKEWKQGQSVFLGNVISYKTISFSWWILSVEFDEPNQDGVKKYFSIQEWQIASYYPNIMEWNVTAGFISTKWIWVKTFERNNTEFVPEKKWEFIIRFDEEGNFIAETDCNKTVGKFMLDKNKFSLSDLASTRMTCPKLSQESYFFKRLKESTSFKMDNKKLELFGSGFTLEFSAE